MQCLKSLLKKKCSVIPFAPATEPESKLSLPNYKDKNKDWPHLKFDSPLEAKGDWSVAGALSLMSSDAMLLIGGREFAKQLGLLALGLKKPVYFLPEVGGSSAELSGAMALT